jgi:hypothetical protein
MLGAMSETKRKLERIKGWLFIGFLLTISGVFYYFIADILAFQAFKSGLEEGQLPNK